MRPASLQFVCRKWEIFSCQLHLGAVADLCGWSFGALRALALDSASVPFRGAFEGLHPVFTETTGHCLWIGSKLNESPPVGPPHSLVLVNLCVFEHMRTHRVAKIRADTTLQEIVDKSVVRGAHRGTEQFGSGFGRKGLHLGAVLNDQVGDMKIVRLDCGE